MRYLTGHTASITALAYSPSGRVLASAGWDGKVRLWDVRSAELLQTLHSLHERALTVSWGDDWTLAVGYRRSATVSPQTNLILYTSERSPKLHFTHYAEWLTAVSDCRAVVFHPEVDRLFTLGRRGEWVSWNHSGHRLESRSLHMRFNFYALGCTQEWLLALNYDGATLHRWKLRTNYRRTDQTKELVAIGHALALTPTGGVIAYSASSRIYFAPPVDVVGEQVYLGQHEDDVLSLAFTRDGQSLVSGGRDGLVKVWDVHRRCERHCFDWELGEAGAVAVAPDGLTAAAGGYDGRILLWDLTDD